MDRINRQLKQQEGVNWSLFTLLVGFSLVHRIIIFSGITNLMCVPFSAYFLQEYSSGLSVMEGLVLIYLLLTAWALIEWIRPVITTRHHLAQATSTRIIHGLVFLVALFSLVMTLRALPLATDVVHHREINQHIVFNDDQISRMNAWRSQFCTAHIMDR